ncbi:MAG TPA: ATP-binding protein [Gammaproteobacteria bacterium]|nr:ATP-binding protein [Gammaproteobacteria bacterium]
MDVNTRNRLFSEGKIDREDLWPKITEYEQQPCTFRFSFGLDALPAEAGIILIRGPRQFGKSTWLELALKGTLEEYGAGSGYFLNGDDVTDADELESRVLEIVSLFHPEAGVKRLFIDEVSAVPSWERALKRIADRGHLRDVLVVTTGSRAADIRRGSERLPGRKGKLKRTEFLFTGVSYKDFHAQFHKELGEDAWKAYLLSGGSPVAAMEIRQRERVPEYFFEMIRDWIVGELVRSGRSRQFLLALMRTLFVQAGSRTGYLKLARESGLANNTIAAEYVEQLSDLLAVIPSYQWDADKGVPLQRKPAKFHFVNLSVALAFTPNRMTQVSDFDALAPQEKGKWIEWLVAQELFRRQCIAGAEDPEALWYWASREHEIDFVDSREKLYEVKLGRSGPLDFAWFAKTLPKRKLLVIGAGEFQSADVKGITIEQFLLGDGFPHPYPGQVEDADVYNDYGRFTS